MVCRWPQSQEGDSARRCLCNPISQRRTDQRTPQQCNHLWAYLSHSIAIYESPIMRHRLLDLESLGTRWTTLLQLANSIVAVVSHNHWLRPMSGVDDYRPIHARCRKNTSVNSKVVRTVSTNGCAAQIYTHFVFSSELTADICHREC